MQSFNMKVTEFQPSATAFKPPAQTIAFNPTASFVPGNASAAKPFVPSTTMSANTTPFTMNMGASTFQPGGKPLAKAAPAPAPVVAPKPKKEKAVLLLERIVKSSDTDVSSDDITEEDTKKVAELKKSIDTVKADKKISVQLLTTFCTDIANLVKLPPQLVKMSVHSRLVARGDDGEHKPLLDKGGPKRNQNNEFRDRGGHGGRGRGNRDHHHNNDRYNDRHDGGGRGRGNRHDNFNRDERRP